MIVLIAASFWLSTSSDVESQNEKHRSLVLNLSHLCNWRNMENPQTHTNDISGANWQILGDLELPVRFEADSGIDAWLTELLSPLNLHADFQNKVLTSALEAASQALQVETGRAFEHTHLLIFVPVKRKLEGQTWGFFRIEKIENSFPEKDVPGHAIELYLYLESQWNKPEPLF
jgi:hypothetical protein